MISRSSELAHITSALIGRHDAMRAAHVRRRQAGGIQRIVDDRDF